MSQELTTKESIRLGQAMNIVGSIIANKPINSTFAKPSDGMRNNFSEKYKEETLALYKLLTEIEAEVVANKNKKEDTTSTIIPFPTG